MGKEYGGEGGIRTREKIAPLHDFQSCPFGRSGTSPAWRGVTPPTGPGYAYSRETWDLSHYRQPPARLSTDSNPIPFLRPTSEEHTSELQSLVNLVCLLPLQ